MTEERRREFAEPLFSRLTVDQYGRAREASGPREDARLVVPDRNQRPESRERPCYPEASDR
jgi:hypothetical protein